MRTSQEKWLDLLKGEAHRNYLDVEVLVDPITPHSGWVSFTFSRDDTDPLFAFYYDFPPSTSDYFARGRVRVGTSSQEATNEAIDAILSRLGDKVDARALKMARDNVRRYALMLLADDQEECEKGHPCHLVDREDYEDDRFVRECDTPHDELEGDCYMGNPLIKASVSKYHIDLAETHGVDSTLIDTARCTYSFVRGEGLEAARD